MRASLPTTYTQKIKAKKMKMTVVLLISVVHLLLAFSSSPCATAEQVVLDAEGNVVKTGSKYYMVSAFYGAGGGGIRRADDSECPAKVVKLYPHYFF